ncbi:MAG TPA: GNAT family N-acetyltransferase [Chloroflexota bacterium]|nr:GNAT family N-acetyltransferase [Chloroflexota bacterium]
METMTASAGGSVADASEDLGDGLLLRRARLHDAAAVAALLVGAHAAAAPAAGAAADLDWIGIWARDLMERPHPTMTAGDVVVVEDTGAGRLVSTLNLIPQTWAYAGVPLGVGRVELVGTDPAYQGRGLVRRQLELVHRRSAARGHLLQVISGIPGYYLQFGYTYALAAGGGRTAWRAHVPAPAPGAAEPFRLRLAGAADLAALDEIEQHAAARSRLACVRDHAAWRYELDGRSAASALHSPLLLLEAVGHDARAPRPAGEGRIVGFAVLGNGGFPGTPPAGPIARVRRFEVAPGVSWRAATLCLLRHLTRPRCAAAPAAGPAYEEVRLALGEDHPAYAAAPGVLAQPLAGSAWYVRGPDLPALLRRVRSVLEARLAASLVAGYTGRLSLSFYRDGLRLRLERGHLAAAEAWPRAPFRAADACFPDLTFLQLLMGYRSLDELEDVSPDCRVSQPEARLVLNALFPKQPSAVWPIA